jgi:hypothetical protein
MTLPGRAVGLGMVEYIVVQRHHARIAQAVFINDASWYWLLPIWYKGQIVLPAMGRHSERNGRTVSDERLGRQTMQMIVHRHRSSSV